MNAHPTSTRHSMWRGAAVIAAALTGSVAMLGAPASAGGRDSAAERSEPTWHEQVADRQDMRRVVARMPTGWPATEAMRIHVDQPLGDVVQRARWQRAVELTPTEWPATAAMRAELAG